MAITSNTLFHFTNSLQTLSLILKNNFKASYCIEGDSFVAMICFCDIPLSEIGGHIEKYGGYGIGLSKGWAVNKGLNPVIYLESNSYLAKTMKEGRNQLSWFMWDAVADKDFLKKHLTKFKSPLWNIDDISIYALNYGRFIKNYSETIKEKVNRYYDEREWRYVPPVNIGELEESSPSDLYDQLIIHKTHEKFEAIKTGRKLIDDQKLTFEPEDIRYLIIKSQDEIPKLVSHLKEVGRFDFEKIDKDILICKIVTIESLKEDF
ncbi:MAG: abortive infection system antitoxin AbiGi family protein [Cyclobacteriaceae bacterium]